MPWYKLLYNYGGGLAWRKSKAGILITSSFFFGPNYNSFFHLHVNKTVISSSHIINACLKHRVWSEVMKPSTTFISGEGDSPTATGCVLLSFSLFASLLCQKTLTGTKLTKEMKAPYNENCKPRARDLAQQY